MEKLDEPEAALAMARIECHYFVNGGFFNSPNQLLENIGAIRHIPTEIVQGRYDVVCPPTTAWELHRAGQKRTSMIANAGPCFRSANANALVAATDRFSGA